MAQGLTRGAVVMANVEEARKKVQKEQSFFDECIEVVLCPEKNAKGEPHPRACLFDEDADVYANHIIEAYVEWSKTMNQKKGMYGDNLLDEMRRWVKKQFPEA